MGKRLSLTARFALWTSIVLVTSTIGLVVTVNYVSSRVLAAQADENLDRTVSDTADALDLWIASRERDAVNLSELQPLVDASVNHKFAAVPWLRTKFAASRAAARTPPEIPPR